SFLQRLRTFPGLDVIEGNADASAASGRIDYQITINVAAEPSPGTRFRAAFLTEGLRGTDAEPAQLATRLAGDMAPSCSTTGAEEPSVSATELRCADPAGIAIYAADLLRRTVFPANDLFQSQLQDQLLDPSLDPEADPAIATETG